MRAPGSPGTGPRTGSQTGSRTGSQTGSRTGLPTGPRSPRRLVVVTGTGTEVGKTWVSCALLEEARRRGLTVAARKPMQSFGTGPEPLDASRLATASGEPPSVVCAEERSYPMAMAPPMAASALGRPAPTIAALAADLAASWPVGGCDLALVEGAGGVASPLAADGDTAALVRAIGATRVVLIADPALGVVNSVRLSLLALAPLPAVVFLNRYDSSDDLHRRNAAWLSDVDGRAVSTEVSDLLDRLMVDPPART